MWLKIVTGAWSLFELLSSEQKQKKSSLKQFNNNRWLFLTNVQFLFSLISFSIHYRANNKRNEIITKELALWLVPLGVRGGVRLAVLERVKSVLWWSCGGIGRACPRGEGTPGLRDRRGNLAENNLGNLKDSNSLLTITK